MQNPGIIKKNFIAVLIFSIILLGKLAHGSQTESPSWYIPHHCKLQFAGSIGFLSAGIGYDLFKEKAEIDLFGGYVPVSMGGIAVTSLTLKMNGKFFTFHPWPEISVTPLIIGAFMNYTLGDKFYLFWPSRYPKGYFWWISALRFGPEIGLLLNKKMHITSFPQIKSLGCYFEISTNDRYLASFYYNPSYLSIIHDLMSAGLGVKVSFD